MANKFPITGLVGLSEAQLLSMQATVAASLVSDDLGGTTTSVTTRDLSTTVTPNGSPAEILAAVQYALWKLDPATYEMPDSAKLRRKWLV